MHTRSTATIYIALVLLLSIQVTADASTIWTGPRITFTDPAGGDPTLAVNQDRITPDVWITRGTAQGIFNIEQESGFTHFSSPVDTEWANGTTEEGDPSLLSYTDWNDWAKGVNSGPPSTVGVNAVMYIPSDDIYLDVTFTSWGGDGGGFSYSRATPAVVPEPGSIALLSTGVGTLLVGLRWRR